LGTADVWLCGVFASSREKGRGKNRSVALPPLGIVYRYGEPTPLISVGGRLKKVVEGGRG
jgi:hypothetical protein